MKSILEHIAKSSVILAPVFGVVMVVWLMISCAIYFSSTRADGNVIQLLEKMDSEKSSCYFPVFVFQDSVGIQHTNKASGGSNPPRFPVGKQISVLYRPSNPETGQIYDPLMFWFVPLIFIFISAFYGIGGYLISRWLSKKLTK